MNLMELINCLQKHYVLSLAFIRLQKCIDGFMHNAFGPKTHNSSPQTPASFLLMQWEIKFSFLFNTKHKRLGSLKRGIRLILYPILNPAISNYFYFSELPVLTSD
jgi:hypothetical protein